MTEKVFPKCINFFLAFLKKKKSMRSSAIHVSVIKTAYTVFDDDITEYQKDEEKLAASKSILVQARCYLSLVSLWKI